MSQEIQERTRFDFIRYANCWEDPELLLGCFELRDRCALSIASAGDNSFSLLTLAPRKVVAFDLNPVQLALVELKKCAIARLEYPEFRQFLGFDASTQRLEVYRQRLRQQLSPAAQAYFDRHENLIADGIIHQGKFEHYFQLFHRRILPLIHRRSTAQALLAAKPLEQRRAFYRDCWNNLRFRLLFRLFFNRFVMGRFGRDPEFFKYVDQTFIADQLKQRTAYALTELPTDDNPYLHYILTGNFGPALPHYARAEHFRTIRQNLDALELFHGTPGDVAAHYREKFHAFNLSDIFEYMGAGLTRQVAAQLLQCAAPGARLAYYNMMVERRLALDFPTRLAERPELAAALFRGNRAFFYHRFLIDEVKGFPA